MPYYSIIPQAKLPRTLQGIYTYQSYYTLSPGDIVSIPFRRKTVMGIVSEETTVQNVKNIKSIIQKIGSAPSYFLPLIQWLHNYYITSCAFLWEIMTPIIPKNTPPSSCFKIPSSYGTNYYKLKIHKKELGSIHKIINSQDKIISTYALTVVSKFIIYNKLIEMQFKKGVSTILLTPTLADIHLIIQYLMPKVENSVYILSSELYKSKTLYWNTWQNILEAKNPVLVIGTRSAIFAPLKNIGLIILDMREQDEYKQYDQNPRYDARTIALKISELNGCSVKMFSDGVII